MSAHISVEPGQSVMFCDSRGVVWLGVALSATIRRPERRPVVVVRVGSKTVPVPEHDVLPWRDKDRAERDTSDDSFRVNGDRNAGLGDIIITTEKIVTSTATIAADTIGAVIGHPNAWERIIRVDSGETTRVSKHQIAVYRPAIVDLDDSGQHETAWGLGEESREEYGA